MAHWLLLADSCYPVLDERIPCHGFQFLGFKIFRIEVGKLVTPPFSGYEYSLERVENGLKVTAPISEQTVEISVHGGKYELPLGAKVPSCLDLCPLWRRQGKGCLDFHCPTENGGCLVRYTVWDSVEPMKDRGILYRSYTLMADTHNSHADFVGVPVVIRNPDVLFVGSFTMTVKELLVPSLDEFRKPKYLESLSRAIHTGIDVYLYEKAESVRWLNLAQIEDYVTDTVNDVYKRCRLALGRFWSLLDFDRSDDVPDSSN